MNKRMRGWPSETTISMQSTDQSRVDLGCAAWRIGEAERLIDEYERENNLEEIKPDASDHGSLE
jgi:hypothetical protein